MKLGSLIKVSLTGCEPWRPSAAAALRHNKKSRFEYLHSAFGITDCNASIGSPIAELVQMQVEWEYLHIAETWLRNLRTKCTKS